MTGPCHVQHKGRLYKALAMGIVPPCVFPLRHGEQRPDTVGKVWFRGLPFCKSASEVRSIA